MNPTSRGLSAGSSDVARFLDLADKPRVVGKRESLYNEKIFFKKSNSHTRLGICPELCNLQSLSEKPRDKHAVNIPIGVTMIIDLMQIWKSSLLPKQISMIPEKPESYSDGVPVSALDLPANAKIVFVKDRKLTPALQYKDLSPVLLTAEEQAIVDATAEQIVTQKPPFNYDGDHILLASLKYDTDKNTLYIEAQRAKFSLLVSLNRKKFPNGSPILAQDLYGAGALAPLITTDGKTVLLKSSKINNPFSTAGGYVQSKEADTKLVFDGISLIETTAVEELVEELIGDQDMKARIEVKKFTPSTISFRKPTGGRGFIEFFVAAELNCKLSTLENIIQTNQAPDRKEHTGEYAAFELYSDERKDSYKEWSKTNPAGRDLYPTAVRAASRIFNQFLHGDNTQQFMPSSRIESIPLSIFRPRIPKCRFGGVDNKAVSQSGDQHDLDIKRNAQGTHHAPGF